MSADVPRSNPHQALVPSAWVERFAALIVPGGRVLDLACGYGRHARHLASNGHRVLAVDRDAAALDTLAAVPGIEIRHADLEQGDWPLAGMTFDAIVVVHYLHRPLLPWIAAALDPAGVLIYETFARGNERYGRPSNPDFLLEPGELLDRFAATTHAIAFEQGIIERPFGAVVQRLCAVGRARAWPVALPTIASVR